MVTITVLSRKIIYAVKNHKCCLNTFLEQNLWQNAHAQTKYCDLIWVSIVKNTYYVEHLNDTYGNIQFLFHLLLLEGDLHDKKQ